MSLRIRLAAGAIVLLAAMAHAGLQASASPLYYTDLHDFGGPITLSDGTSGTDGHFGRGEVLIDEQGNMYGTTVAGGKNGLGLVWELTSLGAYKDLHDFGSLVINADGLIGPDGSAPQSGLTIDVDGNLYGTAFEGGANNDAGGVAWEITSAGVYKDLHDFGGTVLNTTGVSGADGEIVSGEVAVDAEGNVYGTTVYGGAYTTGLNGLDPGGIVWRISPSGVYQDLHDFGGPVNVANGAVGEDGYSPLGGVTLGPGGYLYGTTVQGGAVNQGVIWRLSASGSYTDLHDFGLLVTSRNSSAVRDGQATYATVRFDSLGNMYGTCLAGGAFGPGIVWEYFSGGGYEDLHDFGGTVINADGINGPDGTAPAGNLALDLDGNIYGTTVSGGPNSDGGTNSGGGTLWELGVSGAYQDLHDFGGTTTNATGTSGPDGSDVLAGVTRAADGDLFAVTAGGGPNGGGIIARLSTLPTLIGFTVSSNSLIGGNAASATITLSGPAPAGGYVVAISVPQADAPYVSTLITEIVPAGASTYTFNTIQTHAVAATTVVPIAATVQFTSIVSNLTLSPAPGGTVESGVQFFSEPYTYTDLLSNIFESPLGSGAIANWDATNLSYVYQGGTLASPTAVTITPGVGYWGAFPNGGDNLLYLGATVPALTAYSVSLNTGWNSIGDPYTTPTPIAGLTFGKHSTGFLQASKSLPLIVSPTLYYYNNDGNAPNGAYVPLAAADNLIPGQGVWIYAYSATTLTFPLPAGGIVVPPAPPAPTATVSATPVTTTATTTVTTNTFKKRRHY